MGGTKCSFRDCPVNSKRNPNMHFFKFPTKDHGRLQEWAKYCANVPPSKWATRTVCARHFRAESFMNYKMDRLVPKQTPTLLRINRDLALDFASLDQNGEPLLVKLKPPTQPHLIPPKDFKCPLGFVDDDDVELQKVEIIKKQTRDSAEKPQETQTAEHVDLNQEEAQQPAEDVKKSDILMDAEQEQAALAKEKVAAETQDVAASTSGGSGMPMPQNILDIISQLQPSLGIKLVKRPVETRTIDEEQQMLANEIVKIAKEMSTSVEVINKPKVTPIRDEDKPKKILKDIVKKRGMQKEDLRHAEQAKRRKIPEAEQKTENIVQTRNTFVRNLKQEAPQSEIPSQSSHFKPHPGQGKNINTSLLNTEPACFSNDEEENMDLGSDSQDGSDPGEKPSSSEDDLREKLLQDYNKLQAEFDKLSEENAKLKRLQAERQKVPTPTKPASNSLTKPQLYMAIKKYVGPTMAALLRIEMFGGSEDRTWKEDEREFATELLQLGDEVYKYCCDEWRFRLPPLRTARSWLEKKKTEDVEDFLDL
ncbi:titin [Drosophila subpulchrella]|uniref:titin n=1 Tax=Drosophila subpulchrella TaxID=1486046 RepID=UPI0018A18E65|nr:titin [Drosophila subpulchrella]